MGHSLAAGYQTVRVQGSKKGRKNIWCIHYGAVTRNDRNLSHHVEKDETGKVISTRKRDDARVWAKDCEWRGLFTQFVEVDSDGVEVNRFVWRYGRSQASDGQSTNIHSHALQMNPSLFPRHRSVQPVFISAIPQATSVRSAYLPFRTAERILHSQGLKIDRSWFYDLARHGAMEISTDGLLALVAVLEQYKWTYRTFWDFVRDDHGTVIKQVLKAIFSTNDRLIKQAWRWVSGSHQIR